MELARFPSRGGFSVRSIFTFVLAVMITVLLWAILGGAPAHAATTATWNGDTILFDGHGFTKANDVKDTTGTIPSGSATYKAPVQTDSTTGNQKLLVLYFAPGVDPPKATSANYVEFDYANGTLSQPSVKQSVAISPQGTSDSTGSSCSVGGIGWVICPLSTFLADAMDNIANYIAQNFIQVKPMAIGDTSNSMYIAWNVMRTFANIAFVIVFLIIIYSQLTSFGISNYGLKRLLPRLIIAAILVNISYYIAAVAIDLSNVIGNSVGQIFHELSKTTFNLTNDNFAGVNNNPWTTVTTVILAGGGTIGAIYYVSAAGVYFLVPILIGVILTALFVLVLLAARQAIIVIMVIIAPLAFVANLLPNTEKWFKKWQELLMTMLIFYPAFMLVFAGAQLAGQLIIQNAGDNIVTVLFGLAVQVAPLVVTPLLLKLSGGLLGKIAQIANNPRKGILDRTRGWAGERADLRRQKQLQRPITGNPLTWGAGAVQTVENRRRRRKGLTEMYKQRADNKWEQTKTYGGIHERMAEAELDKETIHNTHTAHIDKLKATKGTNLNVRAVELEGAKVSAERASAEFTSVTAAYRAGVYDTSGVTQSANLEAMKKRMAERVIETAAWKQSANASQYITDKNIASSVRHEKVADAHGNLVDNHLLTIAQGYGSQEDVRRARERAQAGAVATLTKLNADARSNSITLIETEAIESNTTVKDYAIKLFKDANKEGAAVLPSRLEAALEIAASDGQVSVFDDARASKFIDQTIVDAVVARHVGDMKSKGGFHIQANPQLSLQHYIEEFNKNNLEYGTTLEEVEATFKHDQNKARLETLSNTNSANLGGVKFGAFAKLADDIKGDAKRGVPSILDVIDLHTGDAEEDEKNLATVRRIFESLRDGLTDPSTRATMTDRLAQAREMEELVRAKFFPDEASLKLSQTERAMPGSTPNLPGPMSESPDLPKGDPDSTDSSPSEDQDQ